MSSSNGTSKLVIGMCMAPMIVILLALFSFSYQKSSQAFTTSVQNRERISVMESQFNEIKTRMEEQRVDSKEIKKTLSDVKTDIQTLINRR